MVEVLGAFQARPPTPPRASSHILIDGDANRAQGRLSLLRTPGDSPLSTDGLTKVRSGGHSKKVNFSPFPPKVIKPPTFNATSMPNATAKGLSSFSARKPSKSILKATNTLHLGSPAEELQAPESFAMLLESVTQQLAGESLSARVDAYIHLLGALKAYDGVPEQEALLSKLGLLSQFIQRDINRDLEKGEVVEQNLTTNALKLGILFIWSASLSGQLPDDFKIFIVDQSLNALQDGKLPKSVLNHYVHVLSTQCFPPKIMTNSRLTRILAVLSDVTDRVSGNGIVSQRLSVYQRLLSQSKTVMASEPELWVENLISAMLHPIKDTRSKAISLGMQAAAALGPNLDVSNTILGTFDKELSQGRRLVSEICERMSRMMSSIESGMHVPQIWSILVLLMKSRRFNIEQWRHFKEWTLILQKCFNCSEPAIKAQATVGWNRFVYAINPSESTSSSMMKMLSKPIISGIERRKNEKPGAPISALMLSSYYNLLYYGFRPPASYKHLDYVWDEWVEQPFLNVFGTSQQLSESACRILSCLLWSSQPRLWNENKVNEVPKFEPEHLVPLESKWIRSRIALILKAFEILFKSSSWERGTNAEPWIATAWRNLSSALADAGSKEIKPSADLMHAIASVLGLFQRLWHGAPASLNGNTNGEFMERFSLLSTSIIGTIGSSPFTEKLLLKTAQETFLTANTPTHRRSHVDNDLDTPFTHLLRIMSSVSDFPESNSYSKLLDSVLECGSRGRLSRGSLLEFLEKCNEVCQLETELQLSSSVPCRQYLWEAVAKLTMKCLNSFPLETMRDRDGSVSRDYDNVIKILSRGLQFPTAHVIWSSLLDAFVRSVRTERGERGIATLIVEPLSDNLQHLGLDQVCLPLKAVVNQALSLPYYQQTKLRPHPFGLNHGSSAPDQALFPMKLVEVVDRVLSEFYQHSRHTEHPEIAEVVESLTSLLGSGVLQFRAAVLDKLQSPLALWLRDAARLLTLENGRDSRLLTACRTLSLAIANLLQTAVPHDYSNLTQFEAIVSAGLESVHKSTANRFIEMWNATFGLQEIVTLPATVQAALQKLEPLVELRLHSPLPPRADSQMDQEMFNFVDSQDVDLGNGVLPQPSSNEHSRTPFGASYQQISRPTTFSSSPIVRAAEWVDDTLVKKRGETTPKRRLRHEDSQIQFVAVESSPPPSEQGSQHLTDRQLEVQERQRGDASLFLEGLRSSSPVLPSPIKVAEGQSPVQLPDMRNSGPASDSPLTPTLAPNIPENDDDFPGSSPTPGTKNRTDLDSQMPVSLSIQPLEPLASDPPSSPPETKVRSPSSRRVTRRASALHRSESLIDVKTGFEKDREKDDPIRIDSSASERRLRGTTKILSGAHDETTEPPGQETVKQVEQLKTEGSETELMDMISDSYSDDLELQLASQLEQEIEFAVDNDGIQEPHPHSRQAQSFPVTRKRKREAAAELAPPNRSKRRSLRHSSISDKGAISEFASKTDNVEIVENTKSASQPTLPSKGASTPLTSPSKHKEVSDSPNPSIESGSRRRSRRLLRDPDSEIASSLAKPEPPPLQKRKSARLEEITASRITEAEPINRTPRSQRLRDRSTTSVHNTPTRVEKLTPAKHQKSPVTAVVNDEGENHKDSLEELGIEQHAVPEEPMSVTETFADENKGAVAEELRRNSRDTDVVMDEATNDAVEIAHPAQTEDYVSQAVQTDDVMEPSEVTGGSILDSLRKVLSDIRKATIGRSFLREMDDMMFDIRVEAHEAAKGHRE